MPDDKKMPGSDYNLDNRAYGAIWLYTQQYHTNLKTRALKKAGLNEARFELEHVDAAQRELQQEIYYAMQRDIQQQQSIFARFTKDFSFIAGGIFVGALLGQVLEIVTTQQPLDSIAPAFWIVGLVGVGLLFYNVRT